MNWGLAAPPSIANWTDMVFYRNFRFVCAAQATLIVVNSLIIAQMVLSRHYVTTVACGALLIYQVLLLVRYVEFTNRKLRLFIQSIEHSDFSTRFRQWPGGRAFAELRDTIERASSRYRDTAITREENSAYLLGVLQHIGIGLVVYDTDGDVELYNIAGKRLLGVSSLRHISELNRRHPELASCLGSLKTGERTLVSVFVDDEVRQVALRACEFRRGARQLTLLSLHDIGPELNNKELEAWQNLIRVLTHEVKNSLTPIQSLAASVERLVFGDGQQGARQPRIEVAEALQIIQKRSEGLLRFVDVYRDLTHLPKPNYRICAVQNLFARVTTLAAPRMDEERIQFRCRIDPPDMTISVDPQMMEQVLINLTDNAIDAVQTVSNAEICLEAKLDSRSRAVISVTDNGCGIVRESLAKVFIPFYSTKESGSGIGLSLSRQIVRLHGGELSVDSIPSARTTFRMRL